MPTRGDYLTIGVGILGAVALAYYYPWTVGATPVTQTVSSMNNPITLESIPGIDLNSLSMCKAKGLI